MNITIVGTGNMGSGLGKLFASHNHKVFFGSREPKKAQELASTVGANAQGAGIAEAVQVSDVVVLATPYEAVVEVLDTAGSLEDKILIDITNPLTPDYMGLTIGHNTSAAEEIARLVPKARVVKAFNTVGAQLLHAPPEDRWTVFYAGDDDAAKSAVANLINEIGFEAVDAGALKSARYLEPVAELAIQVRFGPYGHGMDFSVGLGLVLRHT
jgi:NADPH-dependent F420 reductase